MNNSRNNWFIILQLYALTLSDSGYAKLGALTDYPKMYIHPIYLAERNGESPSESDPATQHASVRMKICVEITENGLFPYRYDLLPVSVEEGRTFLFKSRTETILNFILENIIRITRSYPDVLSHIYKKIPPESQNYEYSNEYTRLTKFIPNDDGSSILLGEEFVFVCPLKIKVYNIIVPLYVTKTYGAPSGLHTYRFAFIRWFDNIESFEFIDEIFLVEGSAETYIGPDFNVEMYYLELRKRHKPGAHDDDPVCTLYQGGMPNYRLFRLCAIVLTASYFKDKVASPRRVVNVGYFEQEIAFQTEEAKRAAARERYYERTVLCLYNTTKGDEQIYYISRAYRENAVFVSSVGKSDKKLYLEGWFTGVSIVSHE